MGMGMKNRKMSVDTFATNETQMIGLEMAGWQEFPGLGNICQ